MSNASLDTPTSARRGFLGIGFSQWILISMVVGILIGWLAPDFAPNLKPFANIFLRMIKSLIVPLLFATLVLYAIYYRVTDGLRITVRPVYLPERSNPLKQQYVFAYFVRIENLAESTAQLRSRRWRIHDPIGEETEVEGEGVAGEQPGLGPGQGDA